MLAVVRMPLQFFKEHVLTPKRKRSPFVQQASIFEDVVIRCVRYAFANIPATVGRVFFSKSVALPFIRFRMLRHGYLQSAVQYEEVKEKNMRGLWMIANPKKKPDLVIYYAHGESNGVFKSLPRCLIF